eukprot:CAMPEP_0172322886 /NCGR_PEP_ID=MMETSP1058-20130122/47199_1 /TAXON_ID=83371 /ORGANISM="Detonula confervacea, Strain CCMP 353" /LENGTH=295 /DNA_ID=CAMNT_0013038749 /DNA_START=254 /DNA_END=1138 /DNA_ORIENTATION=-
MNKTLANKGDDHVIQAINGGDGEPHPRVSFRLHDPNDESVNPPDKYESIPKYLCRDKAELSPDLDKRTILNFRTSISTDLKILFVGDSVAGQFAQTFDTSVLGPDNNKARSIKGQFHGNNGNEAHICLTSSAPIRGGGVSAYWRFTNMMNEHNKFGNGACGSGDMKRWGTDQVVSLLDHQYTDPGDDTKSVSVGKFDAAVLRLPFGWMKVPAMTEQRIIEEVKILGQYLGVETVIISTLSFNNNVRSIPTWKDVIKANQMIRDLAENWKPPAPGSGGVRQILVNEFGDFTNQIIW